MTGTANHDIGSTSVPDATQKRPPVWGWAVLGLLVIGALAYGFMRDDVLIEDDFSTPEMLRTWPYDDPSLDYEDDAYHVTLRESDVPVAAFHELPRDVEAMTMTVSMDSVRGEAFAVLECSTEVNIDDSNGTVLTQGYVFIIEPDTGSFAIMNTEFRPIDDGVLAAATQATIGCVADGSATTLSLQVPGEDPVEVEVPGGDTFKGIALGGMTTSASAELVFDDLRVTATNR